MKKSLIILIVVFITGCNKTDEFLAKLPIDKFTDETFWNSESSVRTFAWEFYPTYFTGYASGFDLTWGGYFWGEQLNDDFAPTVPAEYSTVVPEKSLGKFDWSFANIKRANLFIERIPKVPMSDDAKKHWLGVGRFFRAMEYASKVKRFGDFPWISRTLSENDDSELYKERDPRTLVMDSVLVDFKFASSNVRITDKESGPNQLTVNRDVVLAFMSRLFLFEGTWQKYIEKNDAKAKEYLESAKWAADEIIKSGRYTVAPGYRALFNSLNLAGNPEIIMYRMYEVGYLTHSLNSYVNKLSQNGASKSAVESYLAADGLPISVSQVYQGDKNIKDFMKNRDPRMHETFADSLRLNGLDGNFSTTGYVVYKFLNEEIKDKNEGNSNLNNTDAPVIRYGEVLMNYAEACAELGNLIQEDLDKSINALRNRAGVKMPRLQIIGGLPAVNGKVFDDPVRDKTVPSLIWEIRRERRVELMMEGFRNSDLRRWKKLNYIDMNRNPDINRGAWIDKTKYPKTLSVTLEGNKSQGYIIPATKIRTFDNDKYYLFPLPADQLRLYKDRNASLNQNPGW